jgi:hypothetical protein
MANQINKDYFIRDILISRTNSEAGSTSIDSSIEKFEKEALLKVLGYNLYELFIANPTDQRFIDLSEGKEFEFDFCGKTVKRKYVGFKNTEFESLIAYYVYYKHQSVNETFSSTVGEVKPSTENANPASARMKLTRAWNKFIELSGDLNKTYYNRFYNYGVDYFDSLDISTYRHVNTDPSLFNFLLANKDVYPEWEYSWTQGQSGKINIFGI